MDFTVDEELNYEEDLPEDDSITNDLLSKDCAEDDMTDKIKESDEQYLQIDYSEDENLASDETIQETVTSEREKVEKDQPTAEIEKNESTTQENVPSKEINFNQSKKINVSPVSDKTKRKKRTRPFSRRPEFKKKTANALSFNPWLPEYNFTDGRHLLSQRRQLLFNNQMLNLNQDFYPLQNQGLPPLLTIGNTFLQPRTFIPTTHVGIGINNRGFHQQRKNVPNLAGLPFSNERPNFQIDNGKVLLSRGLGYQGIEPNFFLKGNGVRNTGIFDQNQNFNGIINQQFYANNFQISDAAKNGLIYGACFNPNANTIGTTFAKNFGVKNVPFKCLEEEEKKALALKKEARLKRFMNDDLLKKDKLTDSGFEESFQASSPPKVQILQNKEEIIFPEGQQKENTVSNNDHETLPGKPDINKESLLRKVNPFDANAATTNPTLPTKPKQKNETIQLVKEECVDVKPWKSVPNCIPRTETKLSTGCTSVPVKTEPETHVKFVRTISKSFDELTCKKPKIPENKEADTPEKTIPLVEPDKFKEKCFPKQMEPQLTGCIVKVLNIPPTTTTNDILALCSPVGIVMEMKLNFPKENSAVIRFAEPTCAENFFSLYHGQKMNNYFLNVIVV